MYFSSFISIAFYSLIYIILLILVDPIEFTSKELHKLLKPVSYTYFLRYLLDFYCLRKLDEFGFEPLGNNTFYHEYFSSGNYHALKNISKKVIKPTVTKAKKERHYVFSFALLLTRKILL